MVREPRVGTLNRAPIRHSPFPIRPASSRSLGVAWVLGMAGAALATWGAGARLEADGTTALHTVELPLAMPFGVGLDRVTFRVGFGTREVADAEGFRDALSLTLQTAGERGSALLGVADVHGTAWLPGASEGWDAGRTGLVATPGDWPDGDAGTWPVQAAFAVTMSVPREWQGCCTSLWVDLFDNRDPVGSVVVVRDLRVSTKDRYFLLETSASPVGPYAVEMGVTHDVGEKAMSFRAGGVARFFRLRADSEVTLRMTSPTREAWTFQYEFPQPRPFLEQAVRPEGPYARVTNAVLDLARREFRVPRVGSGGNVGFFRAGGGVRTAITAFDRVGGEWRIGFEYRPRVFSLQSSAQPCGPYADEPLARFDTARQTMAVPREAWARFFRIVTSEERGAVRMKSVRREGERWRIEYEGGEP